MSSSVSPVRVRFAPSPTGYLHIGGLRTALYNWLLARRTGGTFLLRIEDTDRTRFVADAEQDILDSLAWAGLAFDEGPGKEGDSGPYHQSVRTEFYNEALDALLLDGKAYIAFDSPEEIEAMRDRLKTDTNPVPRYDWETRGGMVNSLTLPADEVKRRVEAGEEHVVRLLVEPGQDISFTDAVRGHVTFASGSVDDQVLRKSDGLPTYHLANVVDDHLMRITHVIRGEEWLSSTPKHILLYEALGWSAPVFSHLPLILSPTGGKLSKRNAEKQGIPVLVRQYREAGYEPAALVNFLALLGWNPGDDRERFDLEGLAAVFSLDRVGQAGVQFNLDKLAWFNEQVLRERAPADIAAELQDRMNERHGSVDPAYLEQVVGLMMERMRFAHDVLRFDYFFHDPDTYDESAVGKRWKEDSAGLVRSYADRLEALEGWEEADMESALRELAESEGAGAGRIIHPVRLAVSGVAMGPGLFDLLHILGRETVVRRLRAAADRLG